MPMTDGKGPSDVVMARVVSTRFHDGQHRRGVRRTVVIADRKLQWEDDAIMRASLIDAPPVIADYVETMRQARHPVGAGRDPVVAVSLSLLNLLMETAVLAPEQQRNDRHELEGTRQRQAAWRKVARGCEAAVGCIGPSRQQ
jgi:hypothetical protein